MHLAAQKCASVVSRSIWNHQPENLHTVHHGENFISNVAIVQRDSVKQGHSERGRLKPEVVFYDDSLEEVTSEDWLGMLFNESSPENSQFLNDTTANMLHFDSVMRLREEESSGVHHGTNGIKTEEPTVDINRLLFCTSDEPTPIYNSEASSEITIKDNVTNFSKNGNMRNIRNNNKRYENNTTDQLLSSVNMRNYNINSVEDEFYNHSNSFLDSSNKSTDISGVVNNSTVYDPIYKNVLWSETNSVITTPPSYETPDNSRSPVITIDPRNTSLLLDFKDVQFINDEINTPNIIDAIIENEKLDFTSGIGDKIIIKSFTPEEIQQNASSSSSKTQVPDIQKATIEIPIGNITEIGKRLPKKEYVYYDDDSSCSNNSDVDYVPPIKHKRNSIKQNTIVENIFKISKRGRPPKRDCSISSDDYSQLSPNEARYREMRVKNNEASRKSRQKRKNKEVEMSHEMRDLEMENVRLKAQVNELQKTVDSYRDNLMKVMLNKK